MSINTNNTDIFPAIINNTNLPSTYIFSLHSYTIKILIAMPSVISGVYGLIANSLILYFMHKNSLTEATMLSRRSLTDRFIQSLALSDVLCAIISVPLFTSELFVDFITTDSICKGARYVMFFFPVVTIMNYLFIGIERYLKLFHPLKIPSQTVCKRLVVSAWFVGAVVVLLAMPPYVRVRYELGNNEYTYVCKYCNSVKMYRLFFVSFTVSCYIIPSIILTTTCLLILKFIRRQHRLVPTTTYDAKPNMNPVIAARYKVTSLFVSLIFAFIIPYMLFIVYNSVVVILKLQISYTLDYITRMVSGSLVYTNGAIGSTILFYNTTFLRKKMILLFREIFCQSEVMPVINVGKLNQEVN